MKNKRNTDIKDGTQIVTNLALHKPADTLNIQGTINDMREFTQGHTRVCSLVHFVSQFTLYTSLTFFSNHFSVSDNRVFRRTYCISFVTLMPSAFEYVMNIQLDTD